MMKSLAWKEALGVIVLVRRQDFTGKFSSFIWESSEVESETRQVFLTGEREWQTIFGDTFNKSSDVRVGEFLFYEISKATFPCVYFSTDHDGGFIRWKNKTTKAQNLNSGTRTTI